MILKIKKELSEYKGTMNKLVKLNDICDKCNKGKMVQHVEGGLMCDNCHQIAIKIDNSEFYQVVENYKYYLLED